MVLIKILIGVLASSIAIILEGLNNATDSLSALLRLIRTKLAQKHPDEKHPFALVITIISSWIFHISAADMMLHNYGPSAWSGSVNVEIDHKKTVGEIYDEEKRTLCKTRRVIDSICKMEIEHEVEVQA